jgi:hypothetical protein
MELIENDSWRSSRSQPMSIADAVVVVLQPSSDGYIERAAEHAQNNAELLGKLVQMLHEHLIIDDDFVTELIPRVTEYRGAPDDT